MRTMDGRKSARVDSLSKLTTIEQLRERLVEEFDAEPDRQRLFYRGKQVSTSRVAVGMTVTLHMREQRDPYLARGVEGSHFGWVM